MTEPCTDWYFSSYRFYVARDPVQNEILMLTHAFKLINGIKNIKRRDVVTLNRD